MKILIQANNRTFKSKILQVEKREEVLSTVLAGDSTIEASSAENPTAAVDSTIKINFRWKHDCNFTFLQVIDSQDMRKDRRYRKSESNKRIGQCVKEPAVSKTTGSAFTCDQENRKGCFMHLILMMHALKKIII